MPHKAKPPREPEQHGDQDRKLEKWPCQGPKVWARTQSQVSREQTTRQQVSQEQDVLLLFQLSGLLGRASASPHPLPPGSPPSRATRCLERAARPSTNSHSHVLHVQLLQTDSQNSFFGGRSDMNNSPTPDSGFHTGHDLNILSAS